MKIYVYSTLSCDQLYKLADGREVLISGRANVANKNLITPKGVVTEVDENVVEALKNNKIFAAHVRNNFLKIEVVKTDPEKVAKDMTAADKSAQATEDSLSKTKGSAKVKK